MKKTIVPVLIAICITCTASAQRATLADGVITYLDKSYKVGDTLHLAYGSGNNKNFAFISMGSTLTGFTDLDGKWAKSDVLIDKVYKQSGKFYVRGKILDAGALNALGGNKVFVNIEGAVDNKEMKP